MREAMVIAKRELLERVRTKWFVAMTILGPILMIGLIVIPVVIAGKGVKAAKVELVDGTGVLADRLAKAFSDDDQHWQDVGAGDAEGRAVRAAIDLHGVTRKIRDVEPEVVKRLVAAQLYAGRRQRDHEAIHDRHPTGDVQGVERRLGDRGTVVQL